MTQDVLSERVSALGRVPIFRVLPPEVREVLAERAEQRLYDPGEFILRQGEPGSTLFIVLHGLVKIATNRATGSDIILALVADGQLFGEMALLDGRPRSASAVALEPSEVVILTRQAFLPCLRLYPEAAVALLAELSGRLRSTNHLISDLATHNLEARVIHRLLELGDSFGQRTAKGMVIGVRLRQQDLAEMVNSSREQVNRILRSLQQDGLIYVKTQRITLLELEELAARLGALN